MRHVAHSCVTFGPKKALNCHVAPRFCCKKAPESPRWPKTPTLQQLMRSTPVHRSDALCALAARRDRVGGETASRLALRGTVTLPPASLCHAGPAAPRSGPRREPTTPPAPRTRRETPAPSAAPWRRAARRPPPGSPPRLVSGPPGLGSWPRLHDPNPSARGGDVDGARCRPRRSMRISPQSGEIFTMGLSGPPSRGASRNRVCRRLRTSRQASDPVEVECR
jgi:hypothetical protein